jgi:hypothetical protein
MQHAEAIREMASEKYLLGELTPEQREAFEEHFFDCPECALDVRSGAAFLEHSKTVLTAPAAEPVRAAPESPRAKGWLVWLRPAIAVPVMALLLAVIAVQGYRMRSAGTTSASVAAPQILPAASLLAARGETVPALSVRAAQSFLLYVDVPIESRFQSYACELHSPDGALLWSVPVSSEAARNTLPLQIPSLLSGSGRYSLVVRGLSADSSSVELARYPFELQVQN